MNTARARAEFLRALVYAVYDSEKFNGHGGEGLDGRDSPGRRALGDVVAASESALDQVR